MPQKYCRKLQPSEYGARALPTDDRQRDGRATAYSERKREFTFAKNILRFSAPSDRGLPISEISGHDRPMDRMQTICK